MRNAEWKKLFQTKEMEQTLHQLLFEEIEGVSAQQLDERSKTVARDAILEYEKSQVRKHRVPALQRNHFWRRAVIAVAVIALLMVPATQSGRAMAMKLYNMVAEWSDDWLKFKRVRSNNAPMLEFGQEAIQKEYHDFQMLEEETGLAVLQLNSTEFKLDRIIFDYWPESEKTVVSIYSAIEDGSLVTIREKWDNAGEYHITLENQDFHRYTWKNIEWYILEDQVDGTITLYAVLDDHFVMLGVQNVDFVEHVLQYLNL